MKDILIITTSPRRGGNSDTLAETFARGAKEAGNNVEIFSIVGKNIEFCRGCLACQSTQRCIIKDDADSLRKMALDADVIVWATPVYYYSVSGQMKTLIDRLNPLYGANYRFRDVYLLATAAEDEPETVSGTVNVVEGWVACFEKSRLAGVIFAGGVNDKGDISGHKSLEKAYKTALAIK